MISAWMQLSSRVIYTGFSVLGSLYCVLAYLPFTYHHVLRSSLFPALTQLAGLHHWLNLLVFLVAAPGVVPILMRRSVHARQFWPTFGWLAAASAWTLYLLWNPLLPGLTEGFQAYLVALVPLGLALWLLSTGLAEDAAGYVWPEEASKSGGLFAAAVLAAAGVPLVTGLVAAWRQGGGGTWAQGYLWSASAQAVIFLMAFTGLNWLSSIAQFSQAVARAEFVLAHAAIAAAGSAVLATVAFRPLGFDGWPCWVYASILSVALSAAHASAALTLARGRARSGFEIAFATLSGGRPGSATAAVAGGLAVALLTGMGLARASVMDWNNLVQRLFTVTLWIGAFGAAFGFAHRRVPASPRWVPFVILPLVLLGGYRKLQARLTPAASPIERYAGYDAAFAYARELLAPPKGDSPVFQVMARNTNLPHSAPVKPVNIELVPRLERHEFRPHVFIITIDSLRQDYISPYNPKVSFTPALAEFARDSTVFQPAFTHYGGTGLSQPSIWTGGMMIHKQYVTPFAPMNLLEKLIRAEGYEMHVSRDEILKTILAPPGAGDSDLDMGKPTMKFDLCGSLDELAAVTARARGPVFAYTQPQNIHISVIQREGAKPIDSADYTGFYAPYASRLRRMDACFGSFIAKLKQQGIYDSSVVVFTADHGDSLGEDGRWGHAYTLFPEIVRIPLIIHVPANLAASLRPVMGPAFSTDITPTLYRLLGYREIGRIPLAGRPLFTERESPSDPPVRDWYLMASSYASVYGVLSENGRRMYVADGVAFRDYRFDLTGSRSQALAISPEVREQEQARIREGIEEINKLYGFSGQTDGAGHGVRQ